MSYSPRTTAPATNNKNWLHYKKGGYNVCIEINNGSCLPNCVGYAWGRWREIAGEFIRLCANNAEMWYDYNDGYERGQKPKLGAVICWRQGNTQSAADGAGHVAIVEKVYSDGSIVVSASAWGGSRFYTQTIYPPYSFGNFVFQGFIYNPYVKDEPQPTPTPEPQPTANFKKGDKVKLKFGSKIYRQSGYFADWVYGVVLNVLENSNTDRVVVEYSGTIVGAVYAKDLTKVEEPQPEKIKVGDMVKMNFGAHIYNQSGYYAEWVYNTPLYVREIYGDRVVVSTVQSGPITGAVNIADLTKI